MKIVILHRVGGHETGAVVDLDEASARWLAERGYAELLDDEPAETDPRPAAATRRRRRTTAPEPVTDGDVGVGGATPRGTDRSPARHSIQDPVRVSGPSAYTQRDIASGCCGPLPGGRGA